MTFADAFRLHAAGHLAEAEAAYRAVLRQHPRDARVMHNLGLLRAQQGFLQEGLDLIDRAIAVDASLADAHFQRGNVLVEMNRLEEACMAFETAAARKPDFAQAYFALGAVRLQLRRLEQAASAFATAADLAPSDVEAILNLGSVLQELGRVDEALAACDRALAVAPNHPGAHNNRGNALRLSGRRDDALAALERALSLAPDYALARFNLATVLHELERHEEAREEIDRTLAMAPRYPAALLLRGKILIALNRPEEALAAFDQALALEPRMLPALHGRIGALISLMRWEEALALCDGLLACDPVSSFAHNNRGVALRKLGRLPEALAAFERAVELDPEAAEYWFNRAGLLESKGSIEDALASTRKALALKPGYLEAEDFAFNLATQLCEWRGRDELLGSLVSACRRGRKVEPLGLANVIDDPELHQRAARNAAPRACQTLFRRQAPADRIRVAYLSADFRDHPVTNQAISVFERHDRGAFEIYGVCLFPGPDTPTRQRLRKAFEHFVEAHERLDEGVARHVAGLDADIVVDLGGYTDRARPQVLAWRPAPLAVNFLGYPGTLGAPYIDYIIADAVVIAPENERFFDEKIVRLPGSFMPVSDGGEAATPPPRTQEGLPERGFVFCNFNRPDKITPEVFDVWMRLLTAVEGSVLWLSAMKAEAARNLMAEAQVRGVDPQRLVFAQRTPTRAAHLARAQLADLFLDTLPYNAHATATDFLRAGVPVVTCMGRGFAARVAASLVIAAGAPELVTSDLHRYEDLALALARTPDRVASLRTRLKAAGTSPRAYTRSLETAFATMVDRYRRGLAPEGFTVSDQD